MQTLFDVKNFNTLLII